MWHAQLLPVPSSAPSPECPMLAHVQARKRKGRRTRRRRVRSASGTRRAAVLHSPFPPFLPPLSMPIAWGGKTEVARSGGVPDQVKEVGGGVEHLTEEAIDAAAYGITDTIRGVTEVARWRTHACPLHASGLLTGIALCQCWGCEDGQGGWLAAPSACREAPLYKLLASPLCWRLWLVMLFGIMGGSGVLLGSHMPLLPAQGCSGQPAERAAQAWGAGRCGSAGQRAPAGEA